MKKKEAQGLAVLIMIGAPLYVIVQLGESVGWFNLLLIVAVIVVTATVAITSYEKSKKRKRREFLMSKYKDEDLVANLMRRSFWQGQTAEQLRDSLGRPLDVDQKTLKTKKKEVWKYNHQGGNRYALRITLDNDRVVGWDKK